MLLALPNLLLSSESLHLRYLGSSGAQVDDHMHPLVIALFLLCMLEKWERGVRVSIRPQYRPAST